MSLGVVVGLSLASQSSAKPRARSRNNDCMAPISELTDDELADAWDAYRGGTYNVGFMNRGKGSARVIGLRGVTEHQEVLRPMVAARGWARRPAVFVLADAGPGTPLRVRVLVDGIEVGHLSQRESATTGRLLRHLAETGQRLVGDASINRHDGGHVSVEVQVRPAPATRWAAGRKPTTIP